MCVGWLDGRVAGSRSRSVGHVSKVQGCLSTHESETGAARRRHVAHSGITCRARTCVEPKGVVCGAASRVCVPRSDLS